MKINAKGFDDLQKQLKRMQAGADELSRKKSVSFSELFTSKFMQRYTSFSSFDDLLAAGGFRAETTEEFENLPEKRLDAHIAATTKFTSWDKMLEAATDQYVSNKLGL